MKTFKHLLVLAVIFLSACSAGPQLKIGNAIMTMGVDVDSDMRNVHLIAIVGFDEDYAGRYTRITNNLMYSIGVLEGTPEYQYRVVRVNTGEHQGFAWYSPGSFQFSTAAIVPDNMPRLMAYDVVEYRQPEHRFDVLLNFSKTGEGSVVTKILCRKAQPDYSACASALPRIGKYQATGKTGRPYPASVKDYGFTFTPMYDENGKALRPFPAVTAK